MVNNAEKLNKGEAILFNIRKNKKNKKKILFKKCRNDKKISNTILVI
jgi:hypothetical protein